MLPVLSNCQGQTNTNSSGDLENSAPLYFGMPDTINSVDTSPGWTLKGQKTMLTGRVYRHDGKTPAANVLMYYYQTDLSGRYRHLPEEERTMPPNPLGQTHGYIRGWVKTDALGRYEIRTVRPGTYPSRGEPAHVHISIKEPEMDDHYYIDDFVFDDDPLLTTKRRVAMENRGGSGVLRLVQDGDLQIGERDIILGLNIPDYPLKNEVLFTSGRNIGEDVISFTPYHAWGPDKDTKTCPICKYGWYQGILYFVGNQPDWEDIRQWLLFLEAENIKREEYLKVYFVYGNTTGFDPSKRTRELALVGQELGLQKVALTFVPSFSDKNSDIYLNKINQEVHSTIIMYKRARVIDKYINLPPSETNFNMISKRLDETINRFFMLPRSNKH
ncbi:MAG: hypothetical protein Roseis2KO_21390 [Roseivirga sp.]